MLNRYFLSSLTRIADLDSVPFEVEPLPRSQWSTSTSGGVQLVEKLTRIKALTLPERKSWQQLGDLLLTHLPQVKM